jgi:hypothetical protein
MRIGRGNRSIRRKSVSVPLRPPQIPQNLTLARTRAFAVETPTTTSLSYGAVLFLPKRRKGDVRGVVLTWSLDKVSGLLHAPAAVRLKVHTEWRKEQLVKMSASADVTKYTHGEIYSVHLIRWTEIKIFSVLNIESRQFIYNSVGPMLNIPFPLCWTMAWSRLSPFESDRMLSCGSRSSTLSDRSRVSRDWGSSLTRNVVNWLI